MEAPRTRSFEASTTIFMRPAVSLRSMARATLVIGHRPIFNLKPLARASFSVMPMPPSCGSVKTQDGTSRFSIERFFPSTKLL